MRVPRIALLLLAAGLLAVASRPRCARLRAQRIVRISRVVSDLDRAEAFYRDALGFRTISRGQSDSAALFALGATNADAQETVMQLGAAIIALVRFTTSGRPYPPDSQSNDLWFQHLAIVVRDMDAAYAHLSQAAGWQNISVGGPQQLPPSNGSVRAFKFRDPDGHPLELIWFPKEWQRNRNEDALFLGVDHSALAISATTRSLNFYRALGFRIDARSLNQGPAQDRLDGLHDAHARITGLRPASESGPGLELLGYNPAGRNAGTSRLNDTATDWVTIEVPTLGGDIRRTMQDPDGHRLLLVVQGSGLPA